jgi:hypothetical protein
MGHEERDGPAAGTEVQTAAGTIASSSRVMRRKCLTPPASVEVSIGTEPNEKLVEHAELQLRVRLAGADTDVGSSRRNSSTSREGADFAARAVIAS